MAKIKRIAAIVKGKASCITELFERKAKRIMRAVEQSIDYAADMAASYREKAEAIIDTFGDYASSTDTNALESRINQYTDAINSAEEWEAQQRRFEELKEKLNADVTVDDEKNSK